MPSNPIPPTLAEAGRAIEVGDTTPTDLLEAALARIEETDGRLNAFVRLMAASARAEADASTERARTGSRLGPLDGIPIAVKDLYDTAGVVTAGGSAALDERVPSVDATAVRLLREAGALIVGKTNTHELAFGGTTNNVHFGATHNPWNLERVPGGSSGGSGAAIAAGQSLGALGSDTAGSIRIPAAFCGITGHKPSYGLVSRAGVIPLAGTLDHAGPMARTAEDCALMLNVLAGYDARDLDSVVRPSEDFTASLEDGIAGMTLAVIPSLSLDCEVAVVENLEQSLDVLRGLGATVIDREPITDDDNWRIKLAAILLAEAATLNEHSLRGNEISLFGVGVAEPQRRRMLRGLDIPATSYIRALEHRKQVEAAYDAALDGIDAYVVPTSPIVAEPIAADATEEMQPPSKFRNTSVFDHSRQPSISVPNGFDADGLPTGLMISAALFEDARALRIAHAYQGATDFHLQAPAL